MKKVELSGTGLKGEQSSPRRQPARAESVGLPAHRTSSRARVANGAGLIDAGIPDADSGRPDAGSSPPYAGLVDAWVARIQRPRQGNKRRANG